MAETPCRDGEPRCGGDAIAAPHQPRAELCEGGGIELKGGGAEPLTESTRVALCRCGQSGNNPSCDNSHRETGWKAT